jgi:hypothetical protein
MMPDFVTLISEPRSDYTLIDSGDGRKYESYGDRHFIRPEPQAMWAPALTEWPADAEFVPGSDDDGGGRWYNNKPVPMDGWPLSWNNEVHFTASCTPFRHLGFFPDMDPVWRWMREQLAGVTDPVAMNLFGYTGVGTLALSAAGAQRPRNLLGKRGPMLKCQAWQIVPFAGSLMTPPNSLPAKCGAKNAMTAYCWTHPNMAVAPKAKYGVLRKTCPN